jgi:hypothetical protein
VDELATKTLLHLRSNRPIDFGRKAEPFEGAGMGIMVLYAVRRTQLLCLASAKDFSLRNYKRASPCARKSPRPPPSSNLKSFSNLSPRSTTSYSQVPFASLISNLSIFFQVLITLDQ